MGGASNPDAAPVRPIAAGAVGVLAAVAVVAVAAVLLPDGMPLGVVLQGLTLGALSSLTALGLVLIYRFNRIINLSQAAIGGLGAAVAILLVTGWGVPYLVVLPVGLAVSMATGWLVQATVVRRFFDAPRLIFMVATLGVAQLIGAAQLALPSVFGRLEPLSTFSSGIGLETRVGPLVLGGDHLVAVVVALLALGGLSWFLRASRDGVAVRAAADSRERALLLGIPVRRLSRLTWVLAAGLSGVAAMLSAPITGPEVGVASGVSTLLVPLTAAVIGRMERVGVTVAAALGIGVFQQIVLWNYPRSSTVDLALFGFVVVALLVQRRRSRRVDDGDLGGYVAVAEVRPVPGALARLPEVRGVRTVGLAVVALFAVGVPLLASESTTTLATYIVINGVIAISLVVLTGWAGQISLGQFALAGVGAAATAALLVEHDLDLFIALPAAMVVGALAATLVGLPALRIPGPFLAVTTLAFGAVVSSYVLNSANFPVLTPARVERPWLLGRIDLSSPGAFYLACLVMLGLVALAARNYRSTRAGRVSIAVRDNERGAASFAIPATRTKLTAFALSGALAGLGGGLYVLALRGMPFSGFNPSGSIAVFTMVVIGGVASVSGALLGVVYVEVANYFLDGAAQLLATGTAGSCTSHGGTTSSWTRRCNDPRSTDLPRLPTRTRPPRRRRLRTTRPRSSRTGMRPRSGQQRGPSNERAPRCVAPRWMLPTAGCRCCTTSTWRSTVARSSRCWARTGPASRRCSASSPDCRGRVTARSSSTASTSPVWPRTNASHGAWSPCPVDGESSAR